MAPVRRRRSPCRELAAKEGWTIGRRRENGGASVCCAEKKGVCTNSQPNRDRGSPKDQMASNVAGRGAFLATGRQPMTTRDAVILFHMGWRRVWTSVTKALGLGLAGLAAPCWCPSDPSNRHRLCPSPAHRQAVRDSGGGKREAKEGLLETCDRQLSPHVRKRTLALPCGREMRFMLATESPTWWLA